MLYSQFPFQYPQLQRQRVKKQVRKMPISRAHKNGKRAFKSQHDGAGGPQCRAEDVGGGGAGQPTDPVDGDVARPGVAGAAAEHDGGQHGVEHASGDAER